MFCACFRFFHGNPSYSKQLCAAPALLIPVATKHNCYYGSGSILSRFGLLGEKLDELKVKCLKPFILGIFYYLSELKCSFGLLSFLALLFVRLSPSPHLATWFSFLFFYPTLFLTPLVFVVFWIINEPDKFLQAYVTMCSTVKLWNEQSTQTVSND